LESELLSGAVQCAVHSLKDLPVENPAGLTVGCIPVRAEARDALICKSESATRPYTIATLPQNAVVGTSSLRRAAQLRAIRPDLKIESLRGNVDTRLRKALEGQYDAIILAGAGLTRLGLDSHVTEWIPLEVMLPAPGQGALAIQCRADDTATLEILSALEDSATRQAVSAERAFLQGLGGGCAVPVAAHGKVRMMNAEGGRMKAESGKRNAEFRIELTGLVISEDGKTVVRVQSEGNDALELGKRLANEAIAQGASEILKLTTDH